MAEPTAEPEWRRLHPATIFVEAVRKALQLGWLIVIAVILLIWGGKPDPYEYGIAAFALLQILVPIHAYLTLRYTVAGDNLLIRSGFLFKRMRTIGLDRVQHINLQRGVLHRFFKVVSLTVETAGSGKAEARLAVVTEEEGQRLRRELIERGTAQGFKVPFGSEPQGRRQDSGFSTEQETEPKSELLWSATWKELFLLGATENRVGYIIGGFFALTQMVPNFDPWDWMTDWIKERSEVWFAGMPGSQVVFVVGFWVIAGVIALFVLGTVVSIVWTFVTHFGFALSRGDGKLRRRYGLFTQHENVLPIQRVQLVRIDRPWLRRMLGYSSVNVETAGTPAEGDEQHPASTALCPLIRQQEVGRFVQLPFEDLDIGTVEWKRVSRYAIRRAFSRYAFLLLLLLLALCLWVSTKAAYGLPFALLAAWGMAVARYRGLGYAEWGRYVLVRAGVWTRRIWIVPCSKIQGLTVAQTPFQRRFGLASLAIATAGGGLYREPTVMDVELPIAREVGDRLSLATHAAGEWLLDGV